MLNLLIQALTCLHYQLVHAGKTSPSVMKLLILIDCNALYPASIVIYMKKKCKDKECGSQLCYTDYLNFYLSIRSKNTRLFWLQVSLANEKGYPPPPRDGH